MGTKFKEVGGGSAMGLGEDLINFFRTGLEGRFGNGRTQPTAGARFGQADPFGSTQGIAGVLNDILSGGAGNLGGSLQQIIERENARNVADLRAGFGARGGSSLGTPAAFAESLYRSEAAPRAATAVGNLQIQTLLPILQLAMGLGSKGISQRQTVAQPSSFASAIGSIAPLIGAAAPFFGPGGAFGKTPSFDLAQYIPDTSGFDPSALWDIPLLRN